MFKKRFLNIFLAVFFACFTIVGTVHANSAPVSGVLDTANILDTSVEDYVYSLNNQLKNTDKQIQVGVLTLQSLNGRSIEEVALQYAREWKIGFKDTNYGVLYVVALQEKKTRLEVSDNLSTILTDGEANRYLSIVKEYYKAKRYSEGTIALIKKLAEDKFIPFSEGKPVKTNDDTIESIVASSIIFLLLVLFVLGFIGKQSLRSGRNTNPLLVLLASIFFDSSNRNRRYRNRRTGTYYSGDSNNDSYSGGSSWGGGGFSGGGSSSGW